MPYQKSVQRVLAGSLNYRLRATELPDNDAQRLENFAFDQSGCLRSRKGHELICNASGSVKQIIHALDARWAATTAAVDKDCTALIACSDAHIVGFKGFVWAMGSKQRKSDGTNDWRWIPEPPEEAPTIATAGEVTTLVDDFTGGWFEDTSIDAADDDDPATEPEPAEFDGNGLIVRGTANSVKSYTKIVGTEGDAEEPGDVPDGGGLDLYDGYDKDDLFRIRLRAKKWSSITGVSFEVDVNDGSFTKDYYKVRLPLKEILAGKKETITVYLRKRELSPDDAAENKNNWGAFERIGQTTDKDWRSVAALRVKVEFSATTKFWFSHWEMVGNEDNTLEGDDFGVYYTYTTEAGHESNPSPKSKLITVNHGSINVSDMVISDDPQVTGMNIYLTGGTLGAVYRVNGAKIDPDTGQPTETEPIESTEYTIIASADDLTNLNIVLEDDHDDPPEADGIAGPYYGRILAWKGSRFYWTHQNKPFAFSNPDGPDGAWADIDENAGDIMHISIRPHEAWIYAENEVFVLSGDPADAGGEVHPTGLRRGTPSRNGVAQAGPADVAYLTSGIYLVDGSGTARKLSARLEPIFQRRNVLLWDGSSVPYISDPTSVCVGYEDGIIRFSHSEGSYTYSIALDRWVSDSRKFTCFTAEGEVGVLAGRSNGEIVNLESTLSDNGASIPLSFLSKAYDCGIHDNEKRVEDLTAFHDLAGQTMTLSLWYAEFVSTSTSITSFGRDRTVFQVNDADGIRGRNFAIGVDGNANNFEVFIDAFDINFYSEAREAKSYDTAVSDGGTPKVKLVRMLHVDLENDGAVTLNLETDVPSFALLERESHSIGGAFRRTEPVVMRNEVYAHDMRVVLDGAGYFHCWGVRALVQHIGHYIHGEKGEYYLSDPVDWNLERVKLAREIEVVYRTLGTATVTVYSDMPVDVFPTADNSVTTFHLTQSVLERTAKLRLTGLVKGRLLQVRIDPTLDFRLEALRIRLKAIGEPNATSWNWVDFPLTPTSDGIWVDLGQWGQDAVA